MRFKFQFILFIFFSTSLVYSQNMQEGFTYLETGKYQKAESYFKTILKEFPDNKTARLCYGRAVGLSGDSAKSLNLFTNLLNDYPDDFEVKLNYGESLLWNKMFNKAKSYYQNIISENNKSFPALLGYANTLSNLKEYQEAIIYVNKALDVMPGNPNALNSKKYIYLGFAYQKQQEQNYPEAEKLLKKNLATFNNDKDTLLNLANLYLISNQLQKSAETYNLIAKNPENKLIALNGLSLVSHLKGEEAKALVLSKQAFKDINADTDTKLIQSTTERYIQALIWNRKYKTAKDHISNLTKNNSNKNWLLALRATLNIYKSNFKKSVSDYNKILVNDSTSFDGNLGKANALKAIGKYNGAYKFAEKTLGFYSNQKDASNFIKNLNTSFTPFWEAKASYTFDNGENKATALKNSLEFPLSTKFKILGNYGYRTTNNKITNNKATTNNLSLGLSYQLLSNITFKGTAGLISANTKTDDYTQLITDLSLNIKPFKLQILDIGYKREVQNFNADLLEREIVMNNFYANYSLSTNFNLGWFTQYYYTTQNDDNTRNLLFTSLYYNILKKPALKAGINYQHITFKENLPAIYFSPEKFNATEVFINIIKNEIVTKPKEWFYNLTAATGLQYIENNKRQSTYRIQGELGYKFSNRCLGNIFSTQSNIASASVAGFTFTEIGLRFKWLLFKKPIFRN